MAKACSLSTGLEVENVTSPVTPWPMLKFFLRTSPRMVLTTAWIGMLEKLNMVPASPGAAAGADFTAAFLGAARLRVPRMI